MVRQTLWQEEEPSRAVHLVAAGKQRDRRGWRQEVSFKGMHLVAHFLHNITIL